MVRLNVPDVPEVSVPFPKRNCLSPSSRPFLATPSPHSPGLPVVYVVQGGPVGSESPIPPQCPTGSPLIRPPPEGQVPNPLRLFDLFEKNNKKICS